MNEKQSFRAGFLSAMIGGYFNLVELLSAHAQSDVPELKALAQSEIPRLRETGSDVVGLVREVQALAAQAGLPELNPPRFPAEYYDWYGAVHAGFAERLELHSPAEVAFRVGNRAGDMVTSLSVAVMTSYLLTAAPETATLREQLTRLLFDVRDALEELRISARNPNAPELLWTFAQNVTDAVDFVNIARRVLFAGNDFNAGELPSMGELLQKKMSDIRQAAETASASLDGH